MSRQGKPDAGPQTLAEFIGRLGDVALARIRMRPLPGTATERDLVSVAEAFNPRRCELIDGVLVEKIMGTPESMLAVEIAALLRNFVRPRKLGVVLGADGMLRLEPGLVRVPDVAFIAYENIPDRKVLREPVAPLVPDLAVEVISLGNTRREMERKVREYCIAGTRLVWLIQPRTETAQVFTSPTDVRRVGRKGRLQGAPVLPGFELSLPELFGILHEDPAAGD